MGNCLQCGQPISDSIRFCKYCGAPQAQNNATPIRFDYKEYLERIIFTESGPERKSRNIPENIMDMSDYVEYYNKFMVIINDYNWLVKKFTLSCHSDHFLQNIPDKSFSDIEKFRQSIWKHYLIQLEIASMSEILDCCDRITNAIHSISKSRFILQYFSSVYAMKKYFRHVIDTIDRIPAIDQENIKILMENCEHNNKIIACKSLFSACMEEHSIINKNFYSESDFDDITVFIAFCNTIFDYYHIQHSGSLDGV